MSINIRDFAVYYGGVGPENGSGYPSVSQINAWGFDTLIVNPVKILNSGTDIGWMTNELQQATGNDRGRDVLYYISASSAIAAQDTFQNAAVNNPGLAWRGTVKTTSANGSAEVYNARYGTPEWLELLKIEVDNAIRSGATGIFIDEANNDFGNPDAPGGPNSREAKVKMLELIVNLAEYAREKSSNPDFRIVVNSENAEFTPAILGRLTAEYLLSFGNTFEKNVADRYFRSVDAIIFENLYNSSPNADNTYALSIMNMLSESYLSRGISVVMLDGQASDLALAYSYGFIPSLSQAAGANYNALPLLNGDGLNRATGANDVLVGNPTDDTINGQAGNDKINGGLGHDRLIGGTGNDTLEGGAGQDRLFGGDDRDSLSGGAGDDLLRGENGNDTLLGGEGSDTIYGEADDDLLYGWLGSDVMWGGAGNDTLWGEQDNDTLLGEVGDDVLLGIDGDDVMFGWFGNDTLYGWFGDDVLWGEAGNDSLLGEAGNDTFIGGLGRDTMTGGAGADRFYSANFEIAAGELDLIRDYDAADRYLFQTGAQIQYFNFNAPGYGTGAGIHVQVQGGVFILDVFGATASQLQAQTLFF